MLNELEIPFNYAEVCYYHNSPIDKDVIYLITIDRRYNKNVHLSLLEAPKNIYILNLKESKIRKISNDKYLILTTHTSSTNQDILYARYFYEEQLEDKYVIRTCYGYIDLKNDTFTEIVELKDETTHNIYWEDNLMADVGIYNENVVVHSNSGKLIYQGRMYSRNSSTPVDLKAFHFARDEKNIYFLDETKGLYGTLCAFDTTTDDFIDIEYELLMPLDGLLIHTDGVRGIFYQENEVFLFYEQYYSFNKKLL